MTAMHTHAARTSRCCKHEADSHLSLLQARSRLAPLAVASTKQTASALSCRLHRYPPRPQRLFATMQRGVPTTDSSLHTDETSDLISSTHRPRLAASTCARPHARYHLNEQLVAQLNHITLQNAHLKGRKRFGLEVQEPVLGRHDLRVACLGRHTARTHLRSQEIRGDEGMIDLVVDRAQGDKWSPLRSHTPHTTRHELMHLAELGHHLNELGHHVEFVTTTTVPPATRPRREVVRQAGPPEPALARARLVPPTTARVGPWLASTCSSSIELVLVCCVVDVPPVRTPRPYAPHACTDVLRAELDNAKTTSRVLARLPTSSAGVQSRPGRGKVSSLPSSPHPSPSRTPTPAFKSRAPSSLSRPASAAASQTLFAASQTLSAFLPDPLRLPHAQPLGPPQPHPRLHPARPDLAFPAPARAWCAMSPSTT
ncbi:hypothetical protein K438DRAFT_26587 [Mycena galopus ATCC 62051]|nr:hypothetical protein K438DRAFT_26587 [Mycena galopus ATCC 62051]